jgi:hypothetical protein
MPDLSIEDILEATRPREEVARICLDGRLLGRHTQLTRLLDDLDGLTIGPPTTGEAQRVAEEIRAVEEQIEAAKVEFRFAGLSSYEFDRLQKRFPREGDKPGWDVTAGAAALVAACAIAPKMTEEQATALEQKLQDGAWTDLFNAAWSCTTGRGSVPPSVRASALTADSGSK